MCFIKKIVPRRQIGKLTVWEEDTLRIVVGHCDKERERERGERRRVLEIGLGGLTWQ